MPICDGKNKEHCCWVNGNVCRFLRDDGPEAERQWVCTLREELNNWNRVHRDQRYLEHVKPHWERAGVDDCGDYPSRGITCGTCGLVG